jgi:hypothetical protein
MDGFLFQGAGMVLTRGNEVCALACCIADWFFVQLSRVQAAAEGAEVTGASVGKLQVCTGHPGESS